MRMTIPFIASLVLSSCSSDPVEEEAQAAGAAVVDAPPTSTALPATYDDPPPPAVSATAGVGVVGDAELHVVNAGPREVRFYGLRQGRRLRARDLHVRHATVMTASGPRVLVLEPRDDYYVAVTSYDIAPTARFDVEVDVIGDPAPPAVVAVAGFAPLASVEVDAFVPAPVVVAPAPPVVRVRGGGGVRVNAWVPSPRVVVVAPPPPSVSIGFGIPTPGVVVVGDHHHHHHGIGVGHLRAHGRGHRRH